MSSIVLVRLGEMFALKAPYDVVQIIDMYTLGSQKVLTTKSNNSKNEEMNQTCVLTNIEYSNIL